MSRWSFPAVLLAGLALAGCSSTVPIKTFTRVAPSAAPAPDVSPSPTASPTPTPSPSPPPTTKAPRLTCSGSAPFDRPAVTGSGPHGSVIGTGSAAVALTFDDGPDPIYTPRMLDLLRQCGVKATFCVNGIKVQAHPSVIRRIHADGHSFCNHTWRHIRQLGTYGQAAIREDLTMTNDAIRAIVPGAKIGYFRAPGGAWTADYVTVARELGMTPLHWHVDTRDWESSQFGKGQPMVNHIVGSVQGDTKPGSIVLAHDFQKPDTIEAFRIVLPWLKARVTLIALPPEGLQTG